MKPWLGMFVALAMLPAALAAQTTTATTPALELPAEEVALPAIARMPEIQSARAQLSRAEADARLRNIGSHETTLLMIPQRRTIQGGPTFNEWEADLTRGVRWPHKARLDREIGAAGAEAAQLALADTYHAGARRLLALWTGWQRARAAVAEQHAQVAIWERDYQAIGRRLALGDAARRDQVAAEAALAQARAAALRAEADLQVAKLALHSTFPSLPLPEHDAVAGEPAQLEGSDAHWSGLIVARSHDIGIAAALARQREAEARRARADRLPDPTVGVRVLDDLGGRERAVGLVVSIPIGVRQRSATAAAAGADALQAEAELAVVRRDIEHEAVDRVAQMRATHAIWVQRSQALRAAVDSASRTERAYALGESGLAELLMARRSALEAALAERGAAIDATEALAMVRIDAHDLWHYHEGEGDDEAHNVGAALTLP